MVSITQIHPVLVKMDEIWGVSYYWACHIMGNISEHGNYDWPDGGATLSGTGHLPGSIGKPRAIAC